VKVSIQVGQVIVQASGVDLSMRQIKALLISCASIAVGLTGDGEPEQEETERAPLGFSVITERADPAEPDYSEFFDDE
jgi:hypothetical protein